MIYCSIRAANNVLGKPDQLGFARPLTAETMVTVSKNGLKGQVFNNFTGNIWSVCFIFILVYINFIYQDMSTVSLSKMISTKVRSTAIHAAYAVIYLVPPKIPKLSRRKVIV